MLGRGTSISRLPRVVNKPIAPDHDGAPSGRPARDPLSGTAVLRARDTVHGALNDGQHAPHIGECAVGRWRRKDP